MTTTASVAVRRAGTQDAAALLALAHRFVARSPFWGIVPPDEEMVRQTILHGLGGAAGTAHLGAVFVLEEVEQTLVGGLGERSGIVGALIGAMVTLPWSRVPVAEEIGGWVDEKHADRIEDLRAKLRLWAKSARAPVVRIDGAAEKL